MLGINRLHIIGISLLLLFVSIAVPVEAQYKHLLTIHNQDEDSRFGEHILKHELNGDQIPDLFVGAPQALVGSHQNAGKIYIVESPFAGDRVIGDDQVIIQGAERDQFVGELFEKGDFNGDGNIDLALGLKNFTSDNKGMVAIFYGPFDPSNPRPIDQADVTITGTESDDGFGRSLAVIPDMDGDNQDELIVGASQSNYQAYYAGVAYLFTDLGAANQFSASEFDILFVGNEQAAQFGRAVQVFEDINGDGALDIAIGAHRSSLNGDFNGAVFIYHGPFNQSQYTDGDANIRILGRDTDGNGTYWGSQIFNVGDLSGDGNEEMVIASTSDQGGKLAYFESRSIWGDPITVADPGADATSDHTIYNAYRSASGFGYSVDFHGDYNLDEELDPIIGAPFTGTNNNGQVVVANNSGGVLSWLPSGGNSVDSHFGQQVLSVGDVYTSEDDSVQRVNDVIVLEIDDFWVSAPGDEVAIDGSNLTTGAIHLFTGTIKKPSASLSYEPSFKAEIGDTIDVTAQYVKGSMPIDVSWLRINGDTTFISPDNNPYNAPVTSDSAVSLTMDYFVQDEIGFYVNRRANLQFAAYPAPFSLNDFYEEDTLSISGDPNKSVTFTSTASADTNGYNLNYRLILSLEEDSADVLNQDVTRYGLKNSNEITVSYSTINDFLRDKGVELNRTTTIYWTFLVSNGVFQRLANGGKLKPLNVIREGLDPYFSLSEGEKLWVIDGRASQTLSVEWGRVVAENPNATIRYRFRLHSEQDTSSTVLLDELSNNDGFDTNFNITYGQLSQVLEDNGLKEAAKQDTIQLGYTVEAIFDDGEKTYYPTQVVESMKVRLLNLVGLPREPDTERPKEFVLHSNYPNPFNPTTTLQYSLPEPREVQIRVFNILGQPIYSWGSGGKVSTGMHTHQINGMEWSSGIYLYQIQAGNEQRTGKMSLVK
ncbi:MAG: T9SS type A sorting domain-containing protein [Bacteroidota bacterium]